MSRYDGMSHAAIAEKMSISKNTVENQISAALKYLRARLGEDSVLAVILIHLII